MIYPFYINPAFKHQCPLHPKRSGYINWSSVQEIREVQLHIQLNSCSHPHGKFVLGKPLEGSSPLLVACGADQLEVVKIMVEEWDVDVNASAVFYNYSNRKMKETLPLLVAASRGFLEIVEYLVEKGADVDLISSCWNSGKWKYWLSNSETVRILVGLGMSLNHKCSLTGKTLLHYWAGSNVGHPYSVKIVDLLLAKGADIQALDNNSLTALNLAAIGKDGAPNIAVLDYFLGRDDFGLQEKIEALELAGSTILSQEHPDHDSVVLAFIYWNKAMDLRDQGSFSKVMLSDNRVIRWRSVEWTSKHQLEELRYSPFEYRIQAILVRQRILSGISTEALVKHLIKPIVMSYCEQLYRDRRFAKTLEMSWIILEAILGQYDLRDYTWLVSTFVYLIQHSLRELINEKNPVLSSDVLMTTLQLISATDVSHFMKGKLLDTLYYERLCMIIFIVMDLSALVNHEMMCHLYQMYQRRDGNNVKLIDSMLLIACDFDGAPLPTQDLLFLLELGADPNTVNDEDGKNTALHILVTRTQIGEMNSPAIDLLLKSGAHFDTVNLNKKNPLDIWKESNPEIAEIGVPSWATRNVPSLACWSSRCLRRLGIVYKGIPQTLHSFVSLH